MALDPNLRLPGYPIISEHLARSVESDGSIVFFGTGAPIRVQAGAGFAVMVGCLDGKHTTHDITESLAAFFDASEPVLPTTDRADRQLLGERVTDLLTQMFMAGLLEDADPTARAQLSEAELSRHAKQLGVFSRLVDLTRAVPSRYRHQLRLRDASVVVMGDGALPDRCATALADKGVGSVDRIGIRTSPDLDPAASAVHVRWCREPVDEISVPASADLVIMASDTPRRTELLAVNRKAVEGEHPTLFAWAEPDTIHLGPYVARGSSCLECLFSRRLSGASSARDEESWWDLTELDLDVQPIPQSPELLDIAAAMTTLEAVRLLTYIVVPATENSYISFESLTLSTSRERVLRMPGCPACSRLRPPRPYRLPVEQS